MHSPGGQRAGPDAPGRGHLPSLSLVARLNPGKKAAREDYYVLPLLAPASAGSAKPQRALAGRSQKSPVASLGPPAPIPGGGALLNGAGSRLPWLPGSFLFFARTDNVNWPITYSLFAARHGGVGGGGGGGWTAPGDRARGRRARDAPDVSLETPPHRWSIPAFPSTRLPTRSPALVHIRSRRRARARRVQAPRVVALRRDPGPIELARVGGTAAIPSTSSRGASHPGSLPTVALSTPGARPSPASVHNPLVYRSAVHFENARLDAHLASSSLHTRRLAPATAPRATPRPRESPARGVATFPARATAGYETWRARGPDCCRRPSCCSTRELRRMRG